MYELPELEFAYDALEPYLDKENLEIHHSKHHATYVNKFNEAVAGTEYEDMPLPEILENLESVPEGLKKAVTNMGGGAYNHSFFWSILCPSNKSLSPEGELMKAIETKWGSFDQFKQEFSVASVGVFGSGWAWLVKTKEGELEIMTTQNQDCPLSEGKKPLLCLDVWEHAYYLKYRNLRPSFVEAFFHVINWNKVLKNFLEE